ncbi:sulfite exporter TauE/SafE family protein [Kerstersia sp.]|uniref:sulfite exporter TauE/SafE family protein n=1 Tax=Kerstersia sp. TaxID=1930783 RepID=UPI003F90E019
MLDGIGLPPDVSQFFAVLLIFASFFTSALTSAMGLGGGVAMLAIMAAGLPVSSVLPAHGIVQMGSNLGRTAIQRQYVIWPLVLWFSVGSVVGIALGSPVAAHIPERAAKLLLAAFILWAVFGKKPPPSPPGKTYLLTGGALTSFATMIVGATGPLVAAFLAAIGLTKQRLVATHAACLSVQHGLKILAFGFLGFAYAQWAFLLACMIASGVLGTYIGTKLLDNMPERYFRLGFRITMALLCVQMVWQALAP